jgi:hypothetical protein
MDWRIGAITAVSHQPSAIRKTAYAEDRRPLDRFQRLPGALKCPSQEQSVYLKADG